MSIIRSTHQDRTEKVDPRFRYEAGDHVAVYPSNDPVLVNRIGELLGVDLDEVISLINVDGECSRLTRDATRLFHAPYSRGCTEEKSFSVSVQLPHGIGALSRYH